MKELSYWMELIVYKGDIGSSTIMLKTASLYDSWIWHAFLGVVGSNNTVNMINQSLLFTNVLKEEAPNMNFMLNGYEYNQGY